EFGLDADEEARAGRLHDESIVIDLLYWGPVSYRSFDAAMERTLQEQFAAHRNPERALTEAYRLAGRLAVEGSYPEFEDAWRASGVTGGHHPLFVGSAHALATSAAHFQRMQDGLPWVRRVRSAEDF